VKNAASKFEGGILIDQGLADNFLATQFASGAIRSGGKGGRAGGDFAPA